MSATTMPDTEAERPHGVVHVIEPYVRDEGPRSPGTLAVVLLLVAVVLAPFSQGDRAAFSEEEFGRLLNGPVERLEGDEWVTLEPETLIAAGDRIRTQLAPAVVAVNGGRVSIGAGTEFTALSNGAELEAGELLMETPTRFSIFVDFVVTIGQGDWRIDDAVLHRAAFYSGGGATQLVSSVTAPSVPIGRLRQSVFVDGAPSEVAPLRYSATDPWDQRLLSGALAIDGHLENVCATLANAYGITPQQAAFYDEFARIDGVIAEAVGDFGTGCPRGARGAPADVLVSVLVTTLLVDRAALDPADAVATVIEQRGLGATWGLLLTEHDLTLDVLLSHIDDALRRRATQGAVQGPSVTRPPAPAPSPAPSLSPSPSPSTSPTPEPTTQPTEPPEPSPSPSPDGGVIPDLPIDLPEPIDEVVDTVDDLLDDLLPIDPFEGLGDGLGLGLSYFWRLLR